MTIDQLKTILVSERFRPDSFAMNDPSSNESYCIDAGTGLWSVYYSERGNKNDLRTFRSESDACEHLLHRLRSDRTTRLE
jgi:hypothetical protein